MTVWTMGRKFSVRRLGELDGWRRRFVEYGTALVLTMALFAPTEEGRTKPTFAVVRLVQRRGPLGFDPREVVPSGAVLTVPISKAQSGTASMASPQVSPN